MSAETSFHRGGMLGMFRDFPQEKLVIERFLNEIMRRLTRSHAPVASQFGVVTVEEGDRIVMVQPDGSSSEVGLKTGYATAQLDRDDFNSKGGGSVLQVLNELAGSMAKNIETDMFQAMRDGPRKSGSMFRGSTDEDFATQFLEGLEAMDMSFDEDGRPSLVFVMHPDNVAMIQQFLDGQAETSEARLAADRIIERKRNEWLSRESHRRLVD